MSKEFSSHNEFGPIRCRPELGWPKSERSSDGSCVHAEEVKHGEANVGKVAHQHPMSLSLAS